MSEINPQETNPDRDLTANEREPGRLTVNTPLAIVAVVVAVLWASSLLEKWVPPYLALGISCFAGLLMLYPVRAPRYRKHGLAKWALRALLTSAGMSALLLVLHVLWPAVFKK